MQVVQVIFIVLDRKIGFYDLCFRWLIDIISIEIAFMFSKMCYVLQIINGRYFPVSLDVYLEMKSLF